MNVQVIINTRSKLARNERALAIIRKQFGAFRYGIAETACAEDAAEVTRNAVTSNIDTLVVVGGDGTVNGVLDTLAGTGIALGVIPSGTANDLASLYDLPSDVAAACDVILRRQLRAVDLIGINGRYFVTGGGLGWPSKVAADANSIKNRFGTGKLLHGMLGSKLYILSAISALLKTAPDNTPLDIRWDRGSLAVDALTLMISNQPFIGRNFHLSPSAANNDGEFDVCLIEKPRSRAQLAAVMLRVLRGSLTKLSSVVTWRARQLAVRAEQPLPFFGDGEVFESGSEFAIKIFPAALNLIVPEDQGRAERGAIPERKSHDYRD